MANRRRNRPAARAALAAALSVGLFAATERPARADVGPGLAVALVVGVVAADITFFVYDSKMAAAGRLPDRNWAIAESIVAAPQTVLANGGFIVLMAEEPAPAATLAVLVPAGLTAMNVHGIWGAATTHVRPGALYGYSPLIGTNVTLSAAAVGRAVKGHWGSRAFGVMETILTAPQVALGGAQLFHDPANRNIWLAHTAWTGTLLLHGIVSIAAGKRYEESEPPAPPPPPPPVDDQEREKPPLKVPFPTTTEGDPPPRASTGGARLPSRPASPRFQVGPGVVTDGVARTPGVVVTGVF